MVQCQGSLSRRAATWVATLLLPAALMIGAQQAPARNDEAADPGRQAWEEILKDKKVSRDASFNRAVERVSNRVLEAAGENPREWEVRVLVDDNPNAFALPGGYIGVHTGLFDVVENDDQLAAVIAHEVAHVTQHHANQRVQRNSLIGLGLGLLGAAFDLDSGAAKLAATAATLGFVLPFSRDQETQADEVGLHYMARAGYDPRQAVQVWKNFEEAGGNGPPQFLSTHPSPDNRRERLEALLPEVMPVYREHRR